MSPVLRIALVAGAIALAALVLSGVRRSRMRIEDSSFWICLSLLVLVLSVFPDVGIWCAEALGVQSAVNFVLLFFIAVLLVKCFSLARQVSQLENKVKELAQHVAVDRLDRYERRGGGQAAAGSEGGDPRGPSRVDPDGEAGR